MCQALTDQGKKQAEGTSCEEGIIVGGARAEQTIDLRACVLGDVLNKTELNDTRHAESNAAHDFTLLNQSLEDQQAQTIR